MADDTPRGVVRAIASLVAYNWKDEETDYNTAAQEPGNSREGHIFSDLMLIQRWLETFGYPHVQPRTEPEPDTAENPAAQAARDALMPRACGECGTEVMLAGDEPDHFPWCPRHPHM